MILKKKGDFSVNTGNFTDDCVYCKKNLKNLKIENKNLFILSTASYASLNNSYLHNKFNFNN